MQSSVSMLSCCLLQLLARGTDPPWQFVLEPVTLENAHQGAPQGALHVAAEDPNVANLSSAALAAPAAAAATAAVSSVAVGALDFAAPEGFIFLPSWVMEALGLQ